MSEPSRSKRRSLDMPWKPIVVGVDASPEAADAAVFAVAVAHRAETSCHLVHATPGSGHAPRRDSYPYTRRYEQASVQVAAALGDRVPAAVLKTLAVHRGKPAAVLNEAVAALGAELVVLTTRRSGAGSAAAPASRWRERPSCHCWWRWERPPSGGFCSPWIRRPRRGPRPPPPSATPRCSAPSCVP